jgi:aspartate carbamoyltransferase regulatory subunit
MKVDKMPLNVQKINEGTVIDHIPAGAGSRVLQILSSSYPLSGMAALIMNAPSKKLGRKDIVKMEGVYVEEKTANRIALIAPKATMNIIKGGKLVDKHNVQMPHALSGILACPNPNCITNIERAETTFVEEGNLLRCRHCERVFKPDELA